MKKTNDNLMLLGMIFAISLTTANVLTARILDTGFTLMGNSVLIPGAFITYAISYLITDVVGENYGKKEANKFVKYGFIAQLIATILIVITGYLPVASGYENVDVAYKTLLGTSGWVFIGSMTAYAVSQASDVLVFHKVRDYFIKKHGNNKHRWIWNNASTLSSQLLDTVIFIAIAFGLGMGLPANVIIPMMVGQYGAKAVVALLDTPFFYLMTRNTKDNKKEVVKND